MDTATVVILNKLTSACRAGAMSPSNAELGKALREWGILLSRQEIGAIIGGIAADGRIELHAAAHDGNRWFMLPGTDLATVRRSSARERERLNNPPAATAPEPNPTNAYDAAMKLGPPIRIKGRPDSERPMPRVTSVHVETRSLVGNSSEMVAL